MKILVLQLARLGDIFLTWPTIRALKRVYPDAEVHLLVRDRFVAATQGLTELTKCWSLPTQEILAPLIDDMVDIEQSLNVLNSLLADIVRCDFNKIINLSFSPFTSYLTHYLTDQDTEVCGYTRTSDGFLAIPDDGSAYFYAQVGPDRHNRIHLAELFAYIGGVELHSDDWAAPANNVLATSLQQLSQPYITLHIATSELHKSLSVTKWQAVINRLLKVWPNNIVLIGSKSDLPRITKIMQTVCDQHIVNLVGQTELIDLFTVIARTKLLIGCDSSPMHIASLTNTKCFNISLGDVSFWETGPRAVGSRILRVQCEDMVGSDRIVQEIESLLANVAAASSEFMFECVAGMPAYRPVTGKDPDAFVWQLIEAIYMNKDFPVITEPLIFDALKKIKEVNDIFLTQLSAVTSCRNKFSGQITERAEAILSTIMQVVPQVGPLIRWYQTEKIRLGPMALEDLLKLTSLIHHKLDEIVTYYLTTATNFSMGDFDENGVVQK